ncbi:MAG: AAA family ATPase, partial [Bacteroidota bacterium]
LNRHYLFFLRPRKFGKSLFISKLEYYYDTYHQKDFTNLFGKYYIGKNPTPLANQYLTITFDFSAIDTSSYERTYEAFLKSVKSSARKFFIRYPQYFSEEDEKGVLECTFPAEVIDYVIVMMGKKAPDQRIYLLIDEYDHFANEILAFRFKEFSDIVSKNGYVRKFFEAIKIATRTGFIERFFITGVSPITLDSLTSGFNMATNISTQAEFNHMMGFTESEVIDILRGIEISTEQLPTVLQDLKAWYNGYLFNKETSQRVYNSDMVLYFADNYSQRKKYPDTLLDINIASDYTKIRRLFKIKDREKQNLTYLNELLLNGSISAQLVQQFNFVRRFDRHDFISLMFYTGIITIDGHRLDELIFRMPNYVIEQLYYQYFHQILLEESSLDNDYVDVHGKIKAMALDNDLSPLVEFTSQVLTELSTRDKRKFDEKYVKAIFTAALFTSGIYTIHHEFEVKKSPTEKGFVDILLVRRPPYDPTYQFVIELKYLKKEAAGQTEKVTTAAVQQLQQYLQHDSYMQQLTDLKAYVVVFVGNEGFLERVV